MLHLIHKSFDLEKTGLQPVCPSYLVCSLFQPVPPRRGDWDAGNSQYEKSWDLLIPYVFLFVTLAAIQPKCFLPPGFSHFTCPHWVLPFIFIWHLNDLKDDPVQHLLPLSQVRHTTHFQSFLVSNHANPSNHLCWCVLNFLWFACIWTWGASRNSIWNCIIILHRFSDSTWTKYGTGEDVI